jgi:hypothetical protein
MSRQRLLNQLAADKPSPAAETQQNLEVNEIDSFREHRRYLLSPFGKIIAKQLKSRFPSNPARRLFTTNGNPKPLVVARKSQEKFPEINARRKFVRLAKPRPVG